MEVIGAGKQLGKGGWAALDVATGTVVFRGEANHVSTEMATWTWG